jgi:hypothetical protein
MIQKVPECRHANGKLMAALAKKKPDERDLLETSPATHQIRLHQHRLYQ